MTLNNVNRLCYALRYQGYPGYQGFPCGSAGKESACNAGALGLIPGFGSWVGTTLWRRERLPNPVFWPGEFHGLYSPWVCKESDSTERLSLHSCIVVQSLSRVWLSAAPLTAAHQAPLSFTVSQSLLKVMSIESVMLSNHPILCCLLLLLPSIFPIIGVFSNELTLHFRWPKYWNFNFSPSDDIQG